MGSTKENKKNIKEKNLEKESPIEHGDKNDAVVIETDNIDIPSKTVSKNPKVNIENNVKKNQPEAKTLKKKRKKKNKLKVVSGEDEGNQEKVTDSIGDVSVKQQKVKESNRKEVNNQELNKLVKEPESNLDKMK